MRRVAGLVLGFALAMFAADVNEELLSAARKGDLAAVKMLCKNEVGRKYRVDQYARQGNQCISPQAVEIVANYRLYEVGESK